LKILQPNIRRNEAMAKMNLSDHARPFLSYLDDWFQHLPPASLAELVAGHPERIACCSVDLINGFCREGPLASPRVDAVVAPIASIFQRAYDAGVRHFVLTQDTHDPATPEFKSFPPHCVRGTSESEAVDELKQLPFYDQIVTVPKNSLSSHLNTDFEAWLREHPEVDTFVVVGDCTDLCIYSLAMHLRLDANARNVERRVLVPANAVDTYDTPVSTARELGIYAHDSDLHHVLFLHHMAMNGVEVVARLD
jgi:nicotinamidase-related amidase